MTLMEEKSRKMWPPQNNFHRHSSKLSVGEKTKKNTRILVRNFDANLIYNLTKSRSVKKWQKKYINNKIH